MILQGKYIKADGQPVQVGVDTAGQQDFVNTAQPRIGRTNCSPDVIIAGWSAEHDSQVLDTAIAELLLAAGAHLNNGRTGKANELIRLSRDIGHIRRSLDKAIQVADSEQNLKGHIAQYVDPAEPAPAKKPRRRVVTKGKTRKK